MSQVCSASVLLQLSLHPGPRGKAQLLSHRGGRTAHRLSPEKHYGSDGSLPKMGGRRQFLPGISDRGGGRESKHEEVNASFFYLNQTAGEEVTLFPSLSLGWQDILLSHIVLNEEPERPSILLNGNCLEAILRCPLCDSKTNKQTHTSSRLLKKLAQV